MFLLNKRKYIGVRRNPEGAPLDIAEAVVTVVGSVQYTGSNVYPSVSVVYDGETLEANTDYTLNYVDNIGPGPATVTITGTGSFTGSVVKTFYIVSAAGNWLFGLSDFPATIEFSHFAGSTSHRYSQICPSQDESKLLVAFGGSYKARIGTWSGFDPSTFTYVGESGNINAGQTLFTPDGIHYLTQNFDSSSVGMYVGTTEYDVTTIPSSPESYLTVSSSTGQYISGSSISRDGLHLLCFVGSSLVSFDLLTPFDLTSASNKKEYNVGTVATGIFVNQNNGRQILCVNTRSNASGGTVLLITLGSAWDASSVSAVDSLTPGVKVGGVTYTSDVFLRGVAVNNAGNKVVLIGSSMDKSEPRPEQNKAYAALLDFSQEA